MWEEIQDSPGEIYDMEDFYKQLEELRKIMDECVKLEEEQSWSHFTNMNWKSFLKVSRTH